MCICLNLILNFWINGHSNVCRGRERIQFGILWIWILVDISNLDQYTCPMATYSCRNVSGTPRQFKCPLDNNSCRDQTMCLSPDEVCDGVRHCPGADDELFCGNFHYKSALVNTKSQGSIVPTGFFQENLWEVFTLFFSDLKREQSEQRGRYKNNCISFTMLYVNL